MSALAYAIRLARESKRADDPACDDGRGSLEPPSATPPGVRTFTPASCQLPRARANAPGGATLFVDSGGTDWCSEDGALALAAQLIEYWLRRGFPPPAITFEREAAPKTVHKQLVIVRSNMKGGLPPRRAR